MPGRDAALMRALIEGRRGVIFDIDGTLIDTRAAHLEAWSRVTRELGIRVSRRRLEALFGKRSDFWAEAFLPGGTEKERRALVKAKEEAFIDVLPSLEPFPGAIELLRLLKGQGKKIAFATGATKAELAVHMRKLRAGRIVDATVYDAEVKRGKPYPDSYLLALKRLGLKAREVAVVGDSLYDAQAARGAGIACIAVRTGGFSRRALMRVAAAAVAKDVGEILGVMRAPLEGAGQARGPAPTGRVGEIRDKTRPGADCRTQDGGGPFGCAQGRQSPRPTGTESGR